MLLLLRVFRMLQKCDDEQSQSIGIQRSLSVLTMLLPLLLLLLLLLLLFLLLLLLLLLFLLVLLLLLCELLIVSRHTVCTVREYAEGTVRMSTDDGACEPLLFNELLLFT
jgi:hypothetical protein